MRVLLALLLLTAMWTSGSSAQPAPAAQPPGQPPAAPTQSAAPPAAATPAAVPAAAAAPPAPAPKPPPVFEPTPEQRDRARESYGRGQALYAEGKYADARAAFKEAHLAVPNPVVLVGIAECDVKLGNYEDAYAGLEQYLRDRPDAPDRADIEQKRNDLGQQPATLALSSTPEGAAVWVDGQDTGKVTPAELAILRGEHAVEIKLEGYTPVRETVTMRIGVRHDVHVALQAIPPPPPPPPPAEPPPKPEPVEPPTTALWITSIVGATGIVTGTVLGFLALSERSDFDANPTEASADRGERLALFADVAFGIGAMSAVTAVVLYITNDEVSEPEAAGEGSSSKLEITPALSASEVGLVGRGRF